MTTDSKFAPRTLTASEHVRERFEPASIAALLGRNRCTGHMIRRVAKAETIASHGFETWLAGQSARGSDIGLDRNGDEALEAIRKSPSVPGPNFVLDTSRGKHQVVWKVSGFRQDEAESLLHSLANQFGGDLAETDSTRVLRLPGFANRKLPEEFIVQARQESDASHTPRDFPERSEISECDLRSVRPPMGKDAT